MTKKLFFTLLATAAFASCNKFDLNYYQSALENKDAEAINANAAKVFGDIDPEQEWNSINSGTVTVTANAPLHNVAKVQILTESPFMNSNATILAEAEVAKGESVTLHYDAPNVYETLVAACVDNEGHYYAKGFALSDNTVSFNSSSTQRAARRASSADYIDISYLKLEPGNSELSYNAQRAICANKAADTGSSIFQSMVSEYYIDLWKNSGWDKESLWKPTENYKTNSAWEVRNQTVVRTIDAMSEEETATLKTILSSILQRNDANNTWSRKDNLETIRNSEAVKFYNNHLTSDGTTPISLIPIYMPSSEIGSCHLYYYYYNPDNIPSDMTEEQYIKELPKVKAIQCWHTRSNANNKGYGEEDLFKVHEYLLPYYGDLTELESEKVSSTTFCTTDGKLYRIRNGYQLNGEDYYMTYNGDYTEAKMATRSGDNDDDLACQLWQVFTTSSGEKMLYNVAGKNFLALNGDYASIFSSDLSTVQASYFKFDDDNHILRYKSIDTGLGTDFGNKDNKGIWTNKNTSAGDNTKWYIEEYTGSKSVATIQSYTFNKKASTKPAVSLAIPAGYRIGFMLRKLKGSQSLDDYNNIKANNNGCCYSFGKLNQEINKLPGHFGSGETYFTMENDDPRTCYLTANGKTYIGFEDGSDCQFNDLIIEVGGYDQKVLEEAPAGTEEKSSGIEAKYLYEDMEEIEGQAYTMCFEDRPMQADYDLNDVVLRCIRISKNVLQMTLVATGGNDDLVIHGAEGWRYNDTEVHEAFYATEPVNGNRFVNTVKGGTHRDVLSDFVIVPDGVTIPMYLKNIYIENKTTGKMIKVSKKGEAPFAIIVPKEFDYPEEFTPITGAYEEFIKWAQDVNSSNDWYKYEEADKIFPSLFKKW